jgi:hypothetical protein
MRLVKRRRRRVTRFDLFWLRCVRVLWVEADWLAGWLAGERRAAERGDSRRDESANANPEADPLSAAASVGPRACCSTPQPATTTRTSSAPPATKGAPQKHSLTQKFQKFTIVEITAIVFSDLAKLLFT